MYQVVFLHIVFQVHACRKTITIYLKLTGMQSGLIISLVLIPFTPFMSQNNNEWRARDMKQGEFQGHVEKSEPNWERLG